MTERRTFSSWPASCATRFIEDFEGRRLVAYQCSAGVWTIGVGHTKCVKQGDTCTDAQADKWLIEDIRKVCDELGRYVTPDITQSQFIALVSLGFNIGAINVVTKCPKLLRKLNDSDFEGAAHEFLDCDKAGGVRVAGLTRRREAEAKLMRGEE